MNKLDVQNAILNAMTPYLDDDQLYQLKNTLEETRLSVGKRTKICVKKNENLCQKFCAATSTELDYIKTNNVIIDAILNSKYKETLDKGIVFIFQINDLSGIKMCDEDIVVILSNLLNNAIEACEKCSGKKFMKMKLVKEKDNIIISVKNTYDGKLNIKDGEIRTSKKYEMDEHGVGIKNIIEVITKYQGSYAIRNDNNEFYFSVILPN